MDETEVVFLTLGKDSQSRYANEILLSMNTTLRKGDKSFQTQRNHNRIETQRCGLKLISIIKHAMLYLNSKEMLFKILIFNPFIHTPK